MKQDLRRTRWNRLAVRLRVPRSTGVFLVGAGSGRNPGRVLMVGSARNLRDRVLELFDLEELRDSGIHFVHWVADLTVEQARLTERLLLRRHDPPLGPGPRDRYFDILTG